MAQDTALLRYLLKGARRAPGSGSQKDLAFAFDGTNDYISSNGNLGTGVAVKGTDWTGSYVKCYNTGFDMGTIAIDSRSVQTIKRRGSFDSFAATPYLFSYWNGSFGLSSAKLQANGTIQLELQGTGSGRITTVNTFSINTEYNIIIRINNTLPTGTTRVVTDADIFVDGVKQTYTFAATGNSTSTASQAYRGAYSSTLGMTGKMRSLNIWNVALTDGECGTEGVSSTVVNTTGLINSFTPSNIGVNIGRTGYDMNVSGNVSTGSDGDGSYIQFNGNRLSGAGSNAFCGGSATPSYNQTNSFTIKAKVKINSLPPSGSTGIFGSNGDCGINTDSAGNDLFFGLNGSTSVLYTANAVFTLGVYFDAYLVYDATTSKFFCYFSSNGVASSLLNTGGTAGPATFTTDSWRVGDGGMTGTTDTSGPKFVYHAAIRNKALTQAEIDADIALGNTAKNDPSIVAYYIPDNLQYNTQYIANPKALDQSPRSYTGATVTANTDVAPDGTTTADNIVFGAATHRLVQQTITAVTGSSLASKTIIIKAFVKCTAATQTFRFRMDHAGVNTTNTHLISQLQLLGKSLHLQEHLQVQHLELDYFAP